MSEFRGTDETGQVVAPLVPENLRELLTSARQSVVVENLGRGDGFSARATRQGGERWSVEISSGEEHRPLRAEAPNTDAVFDLLRSWAADDGWWQDAFRWEPVSG